MSDTGMGEMPAQASPSVLNEPERFWSERQKWLEECGYMLRPRYLPGWEPSWHGKKVSWLRCEDGQYGYVSSNPHIDPTSRMAYFIHQPGPVMDATRIADNQYVFLKSIEKSLHPYEVEIGTFLSSPPLAGDSKNHCVPIYDVFQDPLDEDTVIIAMPLLRKYNDPRFDTVGEAVSFFLQIFEVILDVSLLRHLRLTSCAGSTIHAQTSCCTPVRFHCQGPGMY